MPKTIEVTNLKPLGQSGKLAEATFVLDGKEYTAKTWVNDGLKVGDKVAVELERKEEEFRGEKQQVQWIKVPKQGGRGGYGGGGGKADPAKIALEEKRLELEKQKQGKFDEKWSKDREAEATRQASIQAQVIVKAAVDLAIAANKPEPSVVNGFALELAETLRQTHAALYDAFAPAEMRGSR